MHDLLGKTFLEQTSHHKSVTINKTLRIKLARTKALLVMRVARQKNQLGQNLLGQMLLEQMSHYKNCYKNQNYKNKIYNNKSYC